MHVGALIGSGGMGRRVDLDDIIDAGDVAEMIGLSRRNSVYTYQKRHADFPKPVLEHGRCRHWLRPDIARWMKRRGKR